LKIVSFERAPQTASDGVFQKPAVLNFGRENISLFLSQKLCSKKIVILDIFNILLPKIPVHRENNYIFW